MKKLIVLMAVFISTQSFALTEEEGSRCSETFKEEVVKIEHYSKKVRDVVKKDLLKIMEKQMEIVIEEAQTCTELFQGLIKYTSKLAAIVENLEQVASGVEQENAN